MGYVELFKHMLTSMPKRKGWGHARKLNMLETTDRLITDTKKRIADYYDRIKDKPTGYDGDIDKLIGDCLLDAVRILLVLCYGKVNFVLNLAKYLDEAHRQNWLEERKRHK